jgi:GTP-binding protein
LAEKERGITIFAKNAAVVWKDHKINILDTPGHADFGGEVERVLSMADGVLLLVDASEGPMPQTRFVTTKAFEQGLRPIVVVNKMDKMAARPEEVVEEMYQLFETLGATDEQLDFPVIFASAANGWASAEVVQSGENMNALLDAILEHVPPPSVDVNGEFQFQVTSLDYSSYVGGIAIGRIGRGTIEKGKEVAIARSDTDEVKTGKVQQIMTFMGMDRVDAESAGAGDLVAMSGIELPRISDTWTEVANPQALPLLSVDEPTLSATFEVNTSPLAGKEGNMLTSRQLRERLEKECLTNVALKVEETTGSTSGGAFKVSGRGELHLGILIETMRREGFEMSIGRPSVIKKVVDGVKMEPFETLHVDVQEGHESYVMEQMGVRGGIMRDMDHLQGRVRMEFSISTMSLIGFRSDFLVATAGTGIMYHSFDEYREQDSRDYPGRTNGVLISNGNGPATGYSLDKLQSRGKLFVSPNDQLYEGMIVGIHVAGDNDLTVNAVRGKQLTNVRASGSDDAIVLHTPMRMSLERAMEFIEDDEIVEVTPEKVRIRKKILKESLRPRRSSNKKKKD